MPDPRVIPRNDIYILDDSQILGLIAYTKSIKQRLLDVLVLFDTWAKSVGLTYCLDWGTLLGAIRHNGHIIPWDDDLDVTADEQVLKGFLVHEKIPLATTVNGHSCKLQCVGYFYKFYCPFGQVDVFPYSYYTLKTSVIPPPEDPSITTDIFKNVTLKEFEGKLFPVPIDSDRLLKVRYGEDYMTTFYITSHRILPYNNLPRVNSVLRKMNPEEWQAFQAKYALTDI